ncbi:MAG: LiaI-LiaF-like domain-containing protein [Candidatus Acidiferrales bacterium]
MANGTKCNCARCKCRGLTGPVVLITIGVLFLLDRLNPHLSFGRMWPVILLAIGAVKLIEATSSTEGHTKS